MKQPPQRGPSYWERVADKAAELGSDGCTGGSAAFRPCCLEHDIHWRTGRTLEGHRISPREANLRFRACMQSRSRFGWWSPVAWWRYLVVSLIDQPEEQQ
jgi:hypothetical protein